MKTINKTGKRKSAFINAFLSFVAAIMTVAVFGMPSYASDYQVPEYVNNTLKLRVAFFEYKGFYEQADDGTYYGYGYELLNKLSNYMNCEYSYVTCKQSVRDQIDLLNNGGADVLAYVTYTPETARLFTFSDVPIGSTKSHISKKIGNMDIVVGDYSTYNGKVVGMLQGDYNNEKYVEFAKIKKIKTKSEFFDSQEALKKALEDGTVDMILSDNIHRASIEEVMDVYSENNVYLATRKGDEEIMRYLNRALALLNEAEPAWRVELANKYFAPEDGGYVLTEDEVMYLKYLRGNNIVLKFLLCPDRYPYSYLDDGKFTGVFPDIIEEICQELDIKYEYIEVGDRYEYRAAIENKEADVIGDFLGDYNTAEQSKYRITDSYLRSGNTIVTHNNFKGEIKEIALPPDYFERLTNVNIDNDFPGVSYTYYDTLVDCVEAVRKGEVDATILFHYTTQTMMSTDYGREFNYLTPPDSSVSFCMATLYSKGYCLRSILNKELGVMSKNGTINSIIEKRIKIPRNPITFRSLLIAYPWIPVACSGLIILVSVFVGWGLSIRAKNKRLKKELHLEEISYHDELTGLRNRRALYRDIYELEKENDEKKRSIGIVYLDVNGLKETNDKYGHEAGDKLLLNATNIMHRIFPNAYLYRLGGDEFLVLSHDPEEASFEDALFRMKECWNETISASVGSLWLKETKELDKNIAAADQMMYQEKNAYYQEKGHDRRRNRRNPEDELIREAMREFAKNVPGGFILCRANEEILLANDAVIKLCECQDAEDFKKYTGNTLRGMVHPEDWEKVNEALSGRLLAAEKDNTIDYRILCKNGLVKYVTDIGRLVHTKQYGDLFYIVIGSADNQIAMA